MISKEYQRLQSLYEKASTERQRIDIFVLMTLEMRNEDVERALIMAEEIIERAEAINYPKGIGNGHNHKGACYWLMAQYEDGLDELTAAHEIALEINDKDLEAKSLNNFGRIYRKLGDMANALRNFEAALEINEALGNELNQTINLTNISNLYYDLGDYDTALEYAMKCLPIFERYNNLPRLIDIYNTLGDIYFKKENFNEALIFFTKNQELTDENTTSRYLADSGVGKVLFKMGRHEEAKELLTNALVNARELDSLEVDIISSYYLGNLYLKIGDYREALKHLQNSHQWALEAHRKHDLLSIHESLSTLYDIMGDIPKAFHHIKEYEKLKEEIFQQATLNKLRNLQIKNQIEVAKKEKEVAIKTAELKQQFMANMSHEIRTPMNAILGFIALLIEKDPKPEQIKYLNAIKQSADNLLIIINDILDFSKIEAGKITIENEPIDIREIVYGIKEIMKIKALEKNLDFNIVIDETLPKSALGDSGRLNQILINLVGNAIKFTEKGHVSLIVEMAQNVIDKANISFKIVDTGIGISKEYVNKIFESFTQAGTDTARKYGGTGLGLTISKQLVDLMHGKITVESVRNVGTTFTVTIPFGITDKVNKKIKIQKISKEQKQLLQKINVLIVEDNEFNQIVAEDTLKELIPNIRIDIAENGQIAIDKIANNNFDLVLMDIQMPVMNGLEATQYIRKSMPANKSNIGIIAMTANVLKEDVLKYLSAGMNAYISKPFNANELLIKMASVLQENKEFMSNINLSSTVQNETTTEIPKENTTVASNHLAVTTEDNTPETILEVVTDPSFLDKFTGGNAAKRNKYIQMFLSNAPSMIDKINDARAAQDWAALKVAAHSLKPQMNYMGIKEEVSHIHQLEQLAAEGNANNETKIDELIANLHKVCKKAFEELQEIIA